MPKSGPKNGRVAPEKSATPENGVTKGTAVGKKDLYPGAREHSYKISVHTIFIFVFKLVESPDEPSMVLKMFRQWIFPGKLFPCYHNRVDENGEILSPPTCDEWFR